MYNLPDFNWQDKIICSGVCLELFARVQNKTPLNRFRKFIKIKWNMLQKSELFLLQHQRRVLPAALRAQPFDSSHLNTCAGEPTWLHHACAASTRRNCWRKNTNRVELY